MDIWVPTLPEAGEGNFSILFTDKMASYVKNREIQLETLLNFPRLTISCGLHGKSIITV
jgi:hypothetical protein